MAVVALGQRATWLRGFIDPWSAGQDVCCLPAPPPPGHSADAALLRLAPPGCMTGHPPLSTLAGSAGSPLGAALPLAWAWAGGTILPPWCLRMCSATARRGGGEGGTMVLAWQPPAGFAARRLRVRMCVRVFVCVFRKVGGWREDVGSLSMCGAS